MRISRIPSNSAVLERRRARRGGTETRSLLSLRRNALLGKSSAEWKQKSSWLSRCVRFVIARHSPERVLEKGLPMEAREKNRCNRSEATQRPIFSGPICLSLAKKRSGPKIIPRTGSEDPVPSNCRLQICGRPRIALTARVRVRRRDSRPQFEPGLSGCAAFVAMVRPAHFWQFHHSS